MISRDTDDSNHSTDPDVDDGKTSNRGSDVQPANYSNVNSQLFTQDDVIGNANINTTYTNEDHNSVLCDKELCEGTIKSFSCTRCKMYFTSLEKLTSHCETHKPAAKQKCHVWEKSFARKYSLTRHLQIHSGERPYKCDVCDKSFAQNNNLTLHLRIHSGERPFKCTVCDKSFTQNNDLALHLRLRIHRGERPFKCNVCDKRFIRK